MEPLGSLKRRIIRIEYLFVICILIQISCRNSIDEINSESIKSTFIDSSMPVTQNITNDIHATFNDDTLKCNQNLNYNQALNFLGNIFSQIDSVSENKDTKNYLKALYLTEFVYASFSFPFLGLQEGKTNHNVSIDNWNKMPLEICYNMGNNNLAPVLCGDRAGFYIRLLDSLLGIKATSISIKNVHTFPLVTIGNRRFILDPYDPFIIFDTSLSNILDYDQLQKLILKNDTYKVMRTKRIFGFPNELISQQLASDILSISNNKETDFSQKLSYYLSLNKANLLQGIDMCSFETFNKIGVIHPCNLVNDKYVISMVDKFNNRPMNLNHFKKYYLAISCK